MAAIARDCTHSQPFLFKPVNRCRNESQKAEEGKRKKRLVTPVTNAYCVEPLYAKSAYNKEWGADNANA